LANQQLNLSTSHIQTLNRNNQRLHSETEHMIQTIEKKHELEKINFQQQIDALTTLLMAKPLNVHRYYYFMPVLKNISINCHCFFISNNNSFYFLLNP
jgi:hypothetical protein